MPLSFAPGAANFAGILGIANGGSGAASAREAQRLKSGIYVLAHSNVAVSHTGNTSETVLATVQIPANAMGANGRIRASALWSYTNSANNKICRCRFGGTGGTLIHSATNTTSLHYKMTTEGGNRNATGSQGWPPNTLNVGASGGTLVTGSIDTTAAVDLVFLGTLALGSETITLEQYLVELIAGAGS